MPKRIKVVWSRSALDDLLAIVRYIKLDKPDAAIKFAKSLKAKVANLSRFPERGRIVPELSDFNYRELIIGNYRVIYEYLKEKNVANILAVKTCWQSCPT